MVKLSPLVYLIHPVLSIVVPFILLKLLGNIYKGCKEEGWKVLASQLVWLCMVTILTSLMFLNKLSWLPFQPGQSSGATTYVFLLIVYVVNALFVFIDITVWLIGKALHRSNNKLTSENFLTEQL